MRTLQTIRREAPCHDPNRPRIPPHTNTTSHQAQAREQLPSSLALLFSRPCLWSSLNQSDGSAGLFQPLDDIFDEAVPKILGSVNGRTSSDDALAFPPISPEDMLSLTRYDCIINVLNRICDFQSARPSLPYLSPRPHMIDERRYHPGAHRLPLL